jgi:hypothetical protein
MRVSLAIPTEFALGAVGPALRRSGRRLGAPLGAAE